jgi:drug/metabolite transporter (DMT)-like permease
MLAPISYSLGSAFCWGVADFSGGLASRKANVYKVVLVAHTTGMALMIALALLRGEHMPSMREMLWAVAAGSAGTVGLVALYRALAVGKMGIVAPITAVLTAVLPMSYGLATQGLPRTIQLCGFAIAAVGIILISRPERIAVDDSTSSTPGTRSRRFHAPQGLGLALLASAGFGFFLIFIKFAGASAVYWPLAAARFPAVVSMGIIALLSSQPSGFNARIVRLALIAGVLDTLGNVTFILANQTGRLDVAAVLSALYPAMTVLLAFIVLKESVTKEQGVGIAAILVSVALIAA